MFIQWKANKLNKNNLIYKDLKISTKITLKEQQSGTDLMLLIVWKKYN
jgi:hypothetical protein